MSRPRPRTGPPPVPRLAGDVQVARLANGLTVALLPRRDAPVVTTALFYRAGCRDEARGGGGIAHFLEHMMFKGSSRFGPGEVDLRTQELGGANNAFTSHDATAYHFDFAPDRWTEALAIEADRMAGLNLEPREVDSERGVILEEIAMYEGEPWDALELAVQADLYGAHPYGRPVLGSREDLAAAGPEELAGFHRRFYRPDNAVLVVAGEVGPEAFEAVEAAFGGLAAGAGDRPPLPPVEPLREARRLVRRQGEVSRMLLGLPGPASTHPEAPALRLALAVLAGGRASRLNRALVDEGQLCSWVVASCNDTEADGMTVVAAELVPGADPARVEAEVLRELAGISASPPTGEEAERARRIFVADWVFAHERVHQQALAVGSSLALFDLGHHERLLSGLLAAGPEEAAAAAEAFLAPELGSVVGWSLPGGGPGETG